MKAGKPLIALVAPWDSERSRDQGHRNSQCQSWGWIHSLHFWKWIFKSGSLPTYANSFCIHCFVIWYVFSFFPFIYMGLDFHYFSCMHLFIQPSDIWLATMCWACCMLWVIQHVGTFPLGEDRQSISHQKGKIVLVATILYRKDNFCKNRWLWNNI